MPKITGLQKARMARHLCDMRLAAPRLSRGDHLVRTVVDLNQKGTAKSPSQFLEGRYCRRLDRFGAGGATRSGPDRNVQQASNQLTRTADRLCDAFTRRNTAQSAALVPPICPCCSRYA